MKRLTAKIELTNARAVESAKVNFDKVDGNILTINFKWTNKNTTVKSFENYVKEYLRGFEAFKRSYKIVSLELVEV